MSTGACDGCGEFFAGDQHEIGGPCPICGHPLRPAATEEVRAFVRRLRHEGALSPAGGGPSANGSDHLGHQACGAER